MVSKRRTPLGNTGKADSRKKVTAFYGHRVRIFGLYNIYTEGIPIMKNFRKTSAVVLTVVCVLVLAFSLVACNINISTNETTDNSSSPVSVTIVIGEGDTQQVIADYETGAKYLFDVINELHNRKTDPIALEGGWTQYGLFVTAIGNIAADTTSEYVCVLTSDTTYQDITNYAVTKTYGDKTVVSSTLGVSSLPIKDGEIYMFTIVSFA